ncbi:MAG: DUF4230 domain-containing protein [Chitinophagaceae bacterium]
MKSLRYIAVLLLIIMAGWWLLSRISSIPSFGTLFNEKETTIDNTAVIITNIKSLSQLITISAYDEIVVDSTRNASNRATGFAALYPALAPAILTKEQKIVLIGKTTTHVGIDLQQLTPGDVTVIKDSIHLRLPPAAVLDVILNPSDLEIFDEKGEWSNEALAKLNIKIKYIAAENAKSIGLLGHAEAKAKSILVTFFNAFGYKKIGFSFQQNR